MERRRCATRWRHSSPVSKNKITSHQPRVTRHSANRRRSFWICRKDRPEKFAPCFILPKTFATLTNPLRNACAPNTKSSPNRSVLSPQNCARNNNRARKPGASVQRVTGGAKEAVTSSGLRVSGENQSAEGGDRAAGASGLVTRHQLPATSYQLPVTSYQLPVTSYQLPATRYFFACSHVQTHY